MTSETTTLKGMYFQMVDNQVLSTQGQPDVNLRRLTGGVHRFGSEGWAMMYGGEEVQAQRQGSLNSKSII